jgi:ABC-type branched-subunit amino acid transport system ATPase component
MAFLEVRGLTIRFGGLVANSDVDLDVERGEIVGLIGPNGAGKTTLFNAISGFITPASGRVRLDGEEVLDLLPYERATRGLGRTFQNCRLYPSMSVMDNLITSFHAHMQGGIVANGLRLRRALRAERRARDRAEEVMEVVDLRPYAAKAAGALSYGTLRMTELACLLMLAPRMILLDEPASGIAQRETEALGPLLRRVRDTLGATILIIEHDMPLVMRLSDRLYCLNLGRVIAEGTPRQMQNDPAVVEAYLGRRAAEKLAETVGDRDG